MAVVKILEKPIPRKVNWKPGDILVLKKGTTGTDTKYIRRAVIYLWGDDSNFAGFCLIDNDTVRGFSVSKFELLEGSITLTNE